MNSDESNPGAKQETGEEGVRFQVSARKVLREFLKPET